jgi:hypothetical protein
LQRSSTTTAWQANAVGLANFKLNDFGGNFDRRDLSTMWMNSAIGHSKLSADNVDNIIRASRLSSYGTNCIWCLTMEPYSPDWSEII